MFYEKNSSAVLTLSAPTFAEAEKELATLVKHDFNWSCDDEDGED
jgi:hypothetical protein